MEINVIRHEIVMLYLKNISEKHPNLSPIDLERIYHHVFTSLHLEDTYPDEADQNLSAEDFLKKIQNKGESLRNFVGK